MFTKQPNSDGPIIRVAEGSNVPITCKATGAENLVYDWKRVKKALPNNVGKSNGGSILTIRNIKEGDKGHYYCEVIQGENKVSSMTVQVIVKSKLFYRSKAVLHSAKCKQGDPQSVLPVTKH